MAKLFLRCRKLHRTDVSCNYIAHILISVLYSLYGVSGGIHHLAHHQARNQLETPGVAKSFLRGAQIFQTMSNSFQLCPTDFSRGGEEFCRGRSPPPLVTGLPTTTIKSVFLSHSLQFPELNLIFLRFADYMQSEKLPFRSGNATSSHQPNHRQ